MPKKKPKPEFSEKLKAHILREMGRLEGMEIPSTEDRRRLFKKMMGELALRKMQPLRIYQPMPQQLNFHQCDLPERLAIGSNRAAKTVTCAIEVGMAVQGLHDYIDYPKKNGRAFLVAKDGFALGQVMYRKLFRPGLFKMIPDRYTGLYRVYKPWDAYDRDHQQNCKPSLPLIPKRMIENESWDNKGQGIPKLITLKNGWELSFFSSLGDPPQGADVDLVWFDEEIQSEEWYVEMAARLIDRAGRFLWSATPQAATEELLNLHVRCQDEANDADPQIKEFLFLMKDNPFFPEEEKVKFIKKLAGDPESYRVRVDGQFLIVSYRVYPNFNMELHGCDWFQIPATWARYMIVDPGYANICVLWAAIPPDESHIYIYDEMYLHDCTAKDFAEKCKERCANQNIQEFLIDRKGSQRTEGSGKNLAEQYAEEFAKANLHSVGTKNNFILVGPETGRHVGEQVSVGCNQVRSWLWERTDTSQRPYLQILRGVCPNLVTEMTRYKNRKDQADKPDEKKYSHGPDCIRYLRMRDPGWVEPKKARPKGNPIQNFLREKRRKKKQADGNYVLLG